MPAAKRPTTWWLEMLRRRAERMRAETLDLSEPLDLGDDVQRRATIKFFNAAFRAEESGLRQAHELADEVTAWDPDLGELLRLYGNEEGWHRELLTEFLAYLGGEVTPMGRVTRLLYGLYGRAERMETIVLTNLMFETIGSTTYRLTLRHVRHPALRQMLTILTRDEAFHVPLNVHFLERVLERSSPAAKWRLRLVYHAVFASLLALPLASRPKSKAFDKIEALDLARAYGEQLASLFLHDDDPPFTPPWPLLWALGVRKGDLVRRPDASATSIAAAEASADRNAVEVTAL